MTRGPLLTGLSVLLLSTALASAQVPMPAPNPWRAPAPEPVPTPALTPAGAAHSAFTTQTAPSSINELLGARQPVQASIPSPLPAAFAPAGPPPAVPSLIEKTHPAPSASIGADAPKIKDAIARLDKGQMSDALAIRATLKDRAAVTLFDRLLIRAASRQVGFQMIVGFLNDNPDWPARKLIRKCAEEALYLEDLDAGTIRNFLGNEMPESGLGKLALARVSGKKEAAALVKSVWREDDLSPDTEKKVLSEFGGYLNEADHAARADHFFYHNEVASGQRNAARAGSAYQPIAKAFVATIGKAKNADALLDAVPAKSRNQPGYQFAKIRRLLAENKDKEAANVMLAVSRDPNVVVGTKEWWERRRWLARDILDLGDARTAYRLAAGHANTERVDIADAEFHAGWIALRFLNDPQTARQHSARVVQAGTTPVTASRGNYWMGRTEEAAGNRTEAQRYFQTAAQIGTTYYGQLARAKLGMGSEPIQPLRPSAAAREAFERNSAVRAIRMLYAAGAQDRVIPLIAETADGLRDAESLALLAELTDKQGDPRSLLIVGKAGVSNGFPLEAASWPLSGVPKFKPVGASVEPAVVHAIARQESAFHAAAVSKAGARGLLQMLPETAKRTASKVGVPFDKNKLTTDPAFNATLGAAHLGELVDNYDGSYILTFAAYNAGPGRARDWVARYGDPRNPNIDPVDWVERIPFTETRNYVQRVMENVQVYRARMGEKAPRTIEADLRRGPG